MDQGTCNKLKDNVYFTFIFLDDDESKWSASEINDIWFNQIKEAMHYIQLNANYYKTNVNIQKGIYSSCDEQTIARYHGSINPNLLEKDVEEDILDQAATSLGFSSKHAMHNYLKKHTNREQIAYVIMLNKKGISYAVDYPKESKTAIDYCVVFNGYLGTTRNCSSTTLVHEILHLFGAEDYYDPYKKFPKRKEIAEIYFPNDIMLLMNRNVYLNTVGQYTAYSIGWIDECPEPCKCEDWWR